MAAPISRATANGTSRSSAAKTGQGSKQRKGTGWDVFISQASEDKEEIARPWQTPLTRGVCQSGTTSFR